jgi:hypothetical protein
MGRETRTDAWAVTIDEIEDTGRKAGFLDRLDRVIASVSWFVAYKSP